jgi:Holliday junction DNA helicase RuvA
MIAYLRGTVLHKDLKYLIIDTGNVGYKVASPTEVLNTLAVGEQVGLWIHTVVREDALDLYGFLDKENLEFFELLITISGIGPKSALGILSAKQPISQRFQVLEKRLLTRLSWS